MTRALEELLVPIAGLRLYPRNPRRGDVEAIKRSLVRNGQYRPLVVNRRTSEVLAGNHTLVAAQQLGWEQVAVTYVDVDAELAKRIVLADNRTSDLAGYDDETLAELLQQLPELDGSGYDDAALSRLLDEVSPAELPGAEEEVPARPQTPRTRVGDVWQLGRHRLVCGDARCRGDYERLLGGARPSMLWTDPPYGVAYEGKTERRLRIAGDTADGLEALLRAAFAEIDGVLAPGAALYVAHPAGPGSLVFGSCWRAGLAVAPDARVGQGLARAGTLGLPLPPRADPLWLQARGRAVWGAGRLAGMAATPSKACSRSRGPKPPESTQR